MTKRFLVALTTLVLAAPAGAGDGHIMLSFQTQDPAWGRFGCNIDIPCGCMGRMYVWGLLTGASAGGITGAEYRIEVGPNNLPDPGWMFAETFDPTATILGTGALNPVDSAPRGVTLAWASCQTPSPETGFVLIETVDIFNAGCSTGEVRLRVARRDAASNPFFQCPLFVLCDAPVYTKVCLGNIITMCRNPEPPFPNNAMCSTSGEARINPVPGNEGFQTPPGVADCTIGVQPESWSRVKALYRD